MTFIAQNSSVIFETLLIVLFKRLLEGQPTSYCVKKPMNRPLNYVFLCSKLFSYGTQLQKLSIIPVSVQSQLIF